MREATRLAESGQLIPRVDARRFDLSSVGDAHALIKNRQAQGKVVIDVAS